MKAVFGGAQKKPLMTKVSMRHLNEIVRERNQYSRDALEAWQDFINLKGRMDTEVGKVTKRNNFLVEELESWKQQFLKFQSFAEQLTKETQDLKTKIETHKRENRRLTGLIDQQKDDAARLTTRLSGTEKQRDDALEALVLQQEIAEELERERKRNNKELASLQHTNSTLLRQRDEAQRVVLHLRSLIGGQSHHLEHLVRTIQKTPDLSQYLDGEFEEDDEDLAEGSEEKNGEGKSSKEASQSNGSLRAHRPSRSGDDMGPEMEARLVKGVRSSKRYSAISIADVADRHLRDKTDAIAHIIRNISDQCAAAVEGLQLAHDADAEAEELSRREKQRRHRESNLSTMTASDVCDSGDDSMLNRSGRASSIPPTPDLIHNRSSTAMSIASSITTPERNSHQYHQGADVPTKIIEDSDEEVRSGRNDRDSLNHPELHPKSGLLHRPAGARISALGGRLV
jgi:hypothetical protein